MRPTPRPAKKRPARKSGSATAAVWKMTPRVKTRVDMMSARRRPILSAKKGEARAPKKVPADRMETMADCWDGEMLRLPSALR